MTIWLVAAAMAVGSAPGCRSNGGMVECRLAPPILPVVATAATPPRAEVERPRMTARRVRPVTVAKGGGKKGDKPSEAEIGQHVQSLVAIGDCTGARTYARSVIASDSAERIFATCVGGGLTPERETAAR